MRKEGESGPVTQLLNGIGRENITITDIDITPLSFVPQDGSYVHECGPIVMTKVDIGVMQVFTSQGIVGIGPAPVKLDVEPFIGKNPFDVTQLPMPAGMDVACWDIIGKAKGKPVFQLLAAGFEPKPEVHVYASGGVLWTYYDKGDGSLCGADALIEEALHYRELGFDTFKWRPGTDWEEAGMNPDKLGEVCRKLREAVGPDFNLGLEKKAYDSWTFEECMAIAPIIDDLDFLFFEQPMGDEGPAQFEDYLNIKSAMPHVMLWGGERIGSVGEAQPWLENAVYDAMQTDCYRLGVTENWSLGRMADSYGISMVPHNWSSSLGTMCNTHLVAGLPNGLMCEFFMYPNAFRYGLFVDPYQPLNGTITLSGRPGFGMELVDDLAERFPYVPGPSTFPNPRFPHAWERAREREKQVAARYA